MSAASRTNPAMNYQECQTCATSLRGIAAELNRRGIQTPRGVGQWQAGSVSQLLGRLAG
jgi:hypothetical protein